MSAVHNYMMVQSFAAGADLSDKQNFLVKLNSSGAAILTDTAGERSLGVNLENAAITETTGVVTVFGEKVEVATGGVIAVGASISTDAQGRAITATSGHNILGTALQAATAANQLITIIWAPNGAVA